MRFWVSIDDMRDAIVDLLFLTLQLEQQMRPQGTPISANRMLVLPQADLREIFGLKLQVSSEKVNRDLEVQNFQVLITVLNDYYARLSQAAMLIVNPQFPPQAKIVAVQVMQAAQNLIKRFVERFDVENIDVLVPGIEQAMQMMGAISGAQPMAGPPQLGAPAGPGLPGGGPPVGDPNLGGPVH